MAVSYTHLRGADYSRIGLFIDGVLLHEPFHMLEGTTVTGSGSAFNAGIVEEMELYEGAFPARYGDRSAGILDVTIRDGNRSDYCLLYTSKRLVGSGND